jgi:hypothetical protein
LKDPVTNTRSFTFTEERLLKDARDTYTAISYCADDPKDTTEIIANGISFNAFANLAQAIDKTCRYREIAHNETSYLLWADQICINQKDLAERSHQVGMMYRVYANARVVAANLSTRDSPYVDEACAWIAHMAAPFPTELIDPSEGLIIWSNYIDGKWGEEMDPANLDSAHVVAKKIMEKVKKEIHKDHFLRGFSATLTALSARW